jgi:hypothetical protein
MFDEWAETVNVNLKKKSQRNLLNGFLFIYSYFLERFVASRRLTSATIDSAIVSCPSWDLI